MSELLFITIGYVISMLVGLGFGVFVLLQNSRGAAHRMFFLMTLTLTVFQLSFIVGSNTGPSPLAYGAWFFNLVDVFMALTYLNFIVLALDVYESWNRVLRAAWGIGLALFAAALAWPTLFLPRVVPKLYLKSYLDGGPLYTVMLVFFFALFALSFVVMFITRVTRSEEGRRRIDYYLLSLALGFATGSTAFALVFNVMWDPIPSVLLGTFVIPMVYGMIKKDLLDIRLVVRWTIVFTFFIAAITAALVVLALLSNYLAHFIPGYSLVVVPFLAAFVATAIGLLYWRKAGEAEALKYEFINVATHKFRTPLTRIRWISESLLSRTDLNDEQRRMVREIANSNTELINLSDLLIDAVRTEKEHYQYAYTDLSLPPVVESVLESFSTQMREKGITLTTDMNPELPLVRADRDRLASAINVLVENAVAYTPQGGFIRVAVTDLRDALRFSIRDSGIGISDRDRDNIFKKFYRSNDARHADTEGVGLGLSMAKSIIERQRGSIGADSDGPGKGSEFWFTLPLSRSDRRSEKAGT